MLSENYIVLFLIIALGFLLGRIKVKGISLDISAVIFVALLFGHFGYSVSRDIQFIGLLLFIFTVGIEAGPGFFQAFQSKGIQLSILSVILVSSAGLVTFIVALIFNIDMKLAVGLFTGALTSTPGLAVAIDSTRSTTASIGYGIAYPFGVLGVILFIKLLPNIFKQDIKQLENEIQKESLKTNPVIYNQNFIVENKNVHGKTIAEINIREMTGAIISRIRQDDKNFTPSANTLLKKGDIIKAVGTSKSLTKLGTLIGSKTDISIPLGDEYDIASILVTNKSIVNKTISELDIFKRYNATITRIKRSSIEITPSPDTQIHFGDKLIVACEKDHMKDITKLLGNDDKALSHTDFFPIAAGILIGYIVGNIQLSFSDKFSFQLGLTGGVLISAIILSKIGKTGPIVWTMSGVANNLLRLIGLLFFLASVGTNAGGQILSTYQEYGFKLFIIGAIITIIPMSITAIISRFFIKLDILTLLGALAGSMTSTPGLATVDSITDSNIPHIAYATVYPIAMVTLILCVHILSHL